ncbi:LysR substrate-binding domain-containing protein [Pectobacterium zantedeschiae]|uniref:LysR substrate-binding domain-containing protein n=1 Tax=Pectobacterium zantedeschiae TaxID=2034769 RepID=UPI00101D97B3|nr:LysR substrate-binding domain-containing protein [Pectobacterium zantedeschiae]RYC47023.1 LysR family transcriptional regulator [Pectobacterium zantedeschiae]
MKKRLPPLGSLRAFDKVAELRSFKHAADVLGVSATAVSHQIRLLEEHLGQRVLDRTPRHVALTDKGELLYAGTRQAFMLLQDTVEKVIESPVDNILTLTATTAFISHWLMPRLAQLRHAYPDLDLRLHADDRIVDMQTAAIDIAIRYGNVPDGAVASPCLFEDKFILAVSPKFAITHPEDLLMVPLIHVDGRRIPSLTPDWSLWRELHGPSALDITHGSHFNDETHAIEAAIAGQGAVIASRLILQNALRSRVLYAPFATALDGGCYDFVENPSSKKHSLITRFRNWLTAEIVESPEAVRPNDRSGDE